MFLNNWLFHILFKFIKMKFYIYCTNIMKEVVEEEVIEGSAIRRDESAANFVEK